MGGHHHHHHDHAVSEKDPRYADIKRVTLVGSVLDIALSAFKLVVGYLAQSQALIADGIHSLSDLATNVMVLWAAKHGSKEADEEHPYGHGRIETVATVVLGSVLMVVAFGIVYDAGDRLFHPETLVKPSIWALIVATVSVLSKEWVFHYTMAVAKRVRSDLLKANAWHARSDAISSIIVIIGVGGTMMGFESMDAIAAIGVALMVGKIGWELIEDSLYELIDTALDAERVEHIKEVILGVDGVQELHMLRSRKMGGDALVDVHIQVAPYLSVSEGHYVSEMVRRSLIQKVDEVQDALVHIDHEDDQYSSPSLKLPNRRKVLEDLTGLWGDNCVAQAIERTTLHYCRGKLEIEIIISQKRYQQIDNASTQADELKVSAETLPYVESLKILFNAPN